MTKKFNWKTFAVCIVLTYFVGFLGSFFTSGNTSGSWYSSIRPELTPPSIVFPIVWNILFLLISVSLYFVWISAKKKQKTKIALIFAINYVLNVLWTVLFFGLKQLKLAFAEIILLNLSILAMIIFSWRINKKSSYLLLPYLLWVIFASVLNFLAFS